MKKTILRITLFAIAILASSFSYAQSLSFDATSITIDTDGAIVLVDGVAFDATTNPLKFSQVDMTSDPQAMFCTLRTDWAAQANWNGGNVISSSNNTTLLPGTSSGNTVMGPGAVAASQFINLTETITVGQTNLFVALRKRWETEPNNMFAGDGIQVTVVAPLSIEENTFEGVSVYPNPAKNYLKINAVEGGTIKIFNILGALVKSETNVSREYTMNVSDLTSGVYLLRINFENKSFTQKIVIE